MTTIYHEIYNIFDKNLNYKPNIYSNTDNFTYCIIFILLSSIQNCMNDKLKFIQQNWRINKNYAPIVKSFSYDSY